MLRWFGVDVAGSADSRGNRVELNGETAVLKARDIKVPGDISSAVFFMAAASALPGSEITITNVGLNPTRTAVVDILREMGADIRTTDLRENGEPSGTIKLNGGFSVSGARKPFKLSGDVIPSIIDELPILAVLGTRIEGGLEVRDAGELRYKETDRISAVVENLKRMGAAVEEFSDGFNVGRSALRGAVIDPFGDHRIAMAFAIAGLFAEGETSIEQTNCIDISFPGFFEVLEEIAIY